MDSTIIDILTNGTRTDIKLVNEDDLRSDNPENFTATIKNINGVHSLFPGQIIYLGYYEGMGTVVELVSDKEILRYMNLNPVTVCTGDLIKDRNFLGIANKNHGLQFEYCTEWQGESNMPVRINRGDKIVTYFKQNPMDILDGIYVPMYHVNPTNKYISPFDTVSLNEEQFYEFNDFTVRKPEVAENNDIQPFDWINMTPEMNEETSNGRGPDEEDY